MAALYAAGVRGSTLTAITAWKEILLAVALARVRADAWRERELPFRPGLVDAFALAFAALVVVYALVPQSALDGAAGRHAVALAARHDLVPVAAFFLGRSLQLDGVDAPAARLDAARHRRVRRRARARRRLRGLDRLVADERRRRLLPPPPRLRLPRHRAAPRAGRHPRRPAGELRLQRRRRPAVPAPARLDLPQPARVELPASSSRSSASPGSARRWRRPALLLAAVTAAGLLWTFSRSALLALAVGLVVLALAAAPAGLARARPSPSSRSRSAGRTSSRTSRRPAHWTKADLVYQHRARGEEPDRVERRRERERVVAAASTGGACGTASTTIVHHPQGFGLGNVGQTASRTGTPLKAGESNYTELGVELGVLGAVLWIAWGLALLARARARGAGDRWAAAARRRSRSSSRSPSRPT